MRTATQCFGCTFELAYIHCIGIGNAFGYVFNLYGFAAVFADEADGVGRIGAGSAGVVNVLHR
ncbi:hypothetical protein ACLD9W_11215, partial [Neisseria sp. WLZKY-1]|uniref:hypothetical protein n=1 Tax=Neisseria sp. WLZKY-1 TaxID=3390377 RepID=UPI00397DDEAA